MATKLWAALIVLFTTLLTSCAQILYKLASKNLQFGLSSLLTNYYLIGGIILYAFGGGLLIISLRGGDVSALYPIIAMSYVWVSLLSVFFLNEKMSALRWGGVFVIIAGIVFIGFGSKEPAGVLQ